jgi:hypothetical protein
VDTGPDQNGLPTWPLPSAERHRSPLGLTLLHARVWARQRSLDRALADGHPATGSRLLTSRADQLTTCRMRDRWSASLREIVEEFDHPSPPRLSLGIAGQRVVLSVWGQTLLELSEQLKDRARVSPCGMARLRIVMTDGAGPLLNPHSEALMGELLWWIEEGMERQGSGQD